MKRSHHSGVFCLAENDQRVLYLEDAAQPPWGRERGHGASSWDVLLLGQQGTLWVKVHGGRAKALVF